MRNIISIFFELLKNKSMHHPRHCSSPYASGNDSDTPSSTSSGNDDNDDNETRAQRPTQSLGRMLPLQAHQLTPEFNAVRHHTVAKWFV